MMCEISTATYERGYLEKQATKKQQSNEADLPPRPSQEGEDSHSSKPQLSQHLSKNPAPSTHLSAITTITSSRRLHSRHNSHLNASKIFLLPHA